MHLCAWFFRLQLWVLHMNVNDTVVCQNNFDVEESLTLGKEYKVLGIFEYSDIKLKFIRVRDDNGYEHHEFKSDRFATIWEWKR